MKAKTLKFKFNHKKTALPFKRKNPETLPNRNDDKGYLLFNQATSKVQKEVFLNYGTAIDKQGPKEIIISRIWWEKNQNINIIPRKK